MAIAEVDSEYLTVLAKASFVVIFDHKLITIHLKGKLVKYKTFFYLIAV